MLVVKRITDEDLIASAIITTDMQTPMRPNKPLLKQGDLVLSYMAPGIEEPYMDRYLRRGLTRADTESITFTIPSTWARQAKARVENCALPQTATPQKGLAATSAHFRFHGRRHCNGPSRKQSISNAWSSHRA